MNRFLAVAAVVSIVSVAPLAAESIHETVAADANGTVYIYNLSGTVVVSGWSSPEVEVTGTIGRGAEGLEVTRDGNMVRVAVKIPRNSGDVDDSFIEVKVPEQSRLEVETVSARITVSGVGGELDLGSVSGEITTRGRALSISASSVSGDIEADLLVGGELETVSGDIAVGSAKGRLEAASVSGDITVRGGLLERFEASSTSGDLRVAAQPGPGAKFELEAMSGDIDIDLPAEISADFDLATFSGSIRSALGPAPKRTSKHGPGERSSFTIGSGDARIEAESFSGTITITTR